MIKLHESEIQVRDKVVDAKYGEGVVIEISEEYESPITCKFTDGLIAYYSQDGRSTFKPLPTLGWPGTKTLLVTRKPEVPKFQFLWRSKSPLCSVNRPWTLGSGEWESEEEFLEEGFDQNLWPSIETMKIEYMAESKRETSTITI